MDSTTHQRAMDVLADALEVPAEKRAAFLDSMCRGDPDVRAEVERLLGFETSRKAAQLDSAHDLIHRSMQMPAQIGPYRVRRVIGEGGMGVVYEAEQSHPRRRVALKVIKIGMRHTSMRRRFEYEAQVLARLEHPGIARLYEANPSLGDEQTPAYLAMEYVDGRPIDEYCRARNLNIHDKLRLVIRVCEAVSYAHRIGVIHRDLKPPNILVESDGSPKVLDFGVAKVVGADRGATLLTDAGQLVGTISYMSPERVDSTGPVDTRSDVYSLGVILYELLAGKPPIDVSGMSLLTAARKICSEQPRPLGEMNKRLRGDIETIVARALEKDVSRRYASVELFAADLQRFIDGRPVEARSDSRLYVVRTTAWRYRHAIGVALLALGVLCTFAVYSWRMAQSNAQKSEALRRLLYVSNVGFAHAAVNNNEVPRARSLLDACPADLRGWEWRYLDTLTDQSIRSQSLDCELPRYANVSADRKLVAISSMAREVLVIDMETGTPRFAKTVERGTLRVALTRDRKLLAYGGYAEELTFIELTDRGEMKPGSERKITVEPTPGATPFARGMRGLRFSPDGTLLAAANLFGRIFLYDVATLTLINHFDIGPREPQSMMFTGDGKSLIIGNDGGAVRRYDPRTGGVEQEYSAHTAAVGTMELSSDGKTLITGDFVGYVNVWSVDTGQLRTQIRMEDQWITSVGLSPDNRLMVVGRADGGLFIYDVGTRYPLCQLRGHVRGVIASWFDDEHIVTVGLDSQLRIWLADPQLNATRINTNQKQALGVVFMPDGGSFFTSGTAGTICRWDVHTLRLLQVYERHSETSYYIAVDRAGRRMASASRDKTVKVWDIASGRVVRSIPIDRGHVNSVAITPDGKYVLSGDIEGGIQQWDVESGALIRSWNTGGRVVYSLIMHPDGVHFASGGADGRALLWSLHEPEFVAEAKVDRQLVYEVRFSPDGKELAAVGANGSASLYQIEKFKKLTPKKTFTGHIGAVVGLAFSPDGSRVATCGFDRTIRIWDKENATELLALRGHGNLIQRLAFSPDGNALVSTSDDGNARLWVGTPR